MKFNLFSSSTPAVIGIDISATAVKLVELAGDTKSGFQLAGYAITPLTKDAMVDGNINDLDKVSDAIQLGWKLLGGKEKNSALALPTSSVISKKIIMPNDLTEDEMNTQVEAEASQYIPFSLDEVNIDFQVLGHAPKNLSEVEVLIVASRKEKIEDRVAAAESAGLKVNIMDVESYATQAAYSLVASQLPKSGRGQTVMIVDIGASVTHINVIHDNMSIYSREQNFGGSQLTQEIQRRFGLSLEESEIAKRKGGLPDSYESEVLMPFMQQVTAEVQRAAQFFTSSTHEHQRIDHIILAGGCAAIANIEVMVEQQTKIHTLIANPFNDMRVGSRVKQQQLSKDAPALMIACGLAMRSFAA